MVTLLSDHQKINFRRSVWNRFRLKRGLPSAPYTREFTRLWSRARYGGFYERKDAAKALGL